MTDQHYAPPPGPPPSYRQQDTTTNNAKANENTDIAPPLGSLPFRGQNNNDIPPQPPAEANPPPYQNWMTVEDTSLLPPPPPLPEDTSPTNNASYDDAAQAHAWCAQHPLYTPSKPSPDIHALAQKGHFTLTRPPPSLIDDPHQFTLHQDPPTKWYICTGSEDQSDCMFLTDIPSYFAATDNPLLTNRPFRMSYTIHIKAMSFEDEPVSGIAIGFAAKPYPPWRLPGWHRASLAVHGDDGRRFMNDPWGGRDFVEGFQPGQSITVGMTFSTTPLGAGKVKTTAWLTRKGRTREWAIDEQRDQRDEGVDGLMGEGDLYPAIGVFGGVQFDVEFHPRQGR
ncbi:hypothetical protein EDD37DRAFT_653844 [Exophiala viscosa]|uniref:uncharacterized protein n=1 Tax=Exophiala viscosa TaxID=2486360 RepID=UPI0021955DA2|nr:hypothetical protein EDD37DRAFT_653844 [Exophiala viscosa]